MISLERDEPHQRPPEPASALFAGPGEIRARCRDIDWAATSLGPVEHWPAALREAVRLSLDSAFPMCLYAGPELVLLYNDAFTHALGAGKQLRALGRPAREVWPEGWTRIAPELARVVDGGLAIHCVDQTFTIDRGGGREETVWTYAFSPVRDERGAVIAVHNVATETTARIRAETALRTSEQRLRRMGNVEGVGVLTFDAASGTLLDANDAFLRMTGYTRDAVEARTLTWRTMTPPEYVAVSEAQMEGFAQTGRIGPYEKEYLLADGSRSWMLFAGAALGDGMVVEYCIDISSRKRAEEALRASDARYRALVDNVRDYAIYLVDASGVVTEWTTGAERVKGYTAAEVLGRHFALFYTPEDVAAGEPERVLAQAATTGRAEREAWRVRKGGERFWGNEIATAVRDADGTLVGFAKICRDLTERRLAEMATEQARLEAEVALNLAEHARLEAEAARRAAEAASRAKSEFLAVMSHELRTPLNAIGGYTELIELGIHGPVTDAQRSALGRIQASQRHLLGLIAGVLDYSRVEAGAVQYRLTAVPVWEVVTEAEALIAPQLRARGLGYVWSGVAPELHVRADREKLQQILLNLLGNAVKFTAPRAGVAQRIEVSCTLADTEAGGFVSLHVRDTGEGIAPDQLERIFEPFVQADQRFTRRQDGVGLGLAISRDLARGMGGDLTVESIPGSGSTFTLTLPRA